MKSLNELLSLLRQVRFLRFEARSHAGTGWDGVGTGTVTVSEPEEGVILFNETGTWQPSASGRGAAFNNVFRWSVIHSALRLEHLRHGPEHPVLLFEMSLNADGVWREVSPHMCKADCYTASLSVAGEQLLVAWSIVGPRKQEDIRYIYNA